MISVVVYQIRAEPKITTIVPRIWKYRIPTIIRFPSWRYTNYIKTIQMCISLGAATVRSERQNK